MKKLDILIAIFVTLAWGSNYVIAKLNVQEVPGFLSTAIRFLIIAIILLPFVKKPQISLSKLWTTSIIFGLYISLVYYGLYLGLDSGLSSIIMQLNAPFSIILARFVLKEPFNFYSVLGMVIAFAGAIIVSDIQNLNNRFFSLLALFAAAWLNAAFNVRSRELSKVPALSLLCWNSMLAVPLIFIISYFIEGNPLQLLENATYVFWSSLFYTITIASLLGITGWIYLLQNYSINKIMPFNFLVPLFGVFLSILVLAEKFSWHLVIGGVLIIVGVIFSQIKVKKA